MYSHLEKVILKYDASLHLIFNTIITDLFEGQRKITRDSVIEKLWVMYSIHCDWEASFGLKQLSNILSFNTEFSQSSLANFKNVATNLFGEIIDEKLLSKEMSSLNLTT